MTILSNANAITPALDDGMYGLRFNDPTKHLTWTPTSAGNRRTWTFSCWTKLGAMPAGSRALFGALGGDLFYIQSADLLGFSQNTEVESNFRSSLVVRDPSAWYHLMLRVDTTDATSYRRVRFYMNGFEVTLGTASYPSQNYQGAINNNVRHLIGINETYHDGTGLGGYLSEVTFVDGLSLDPSYFSEEDADWGHRKPKAYEGAFGTNGFYLDMKQDTTNDHFNTLLYTGNGGTQSVTGMGFQPDLVWAKRRNGASGHLLYDSLRGATNVLRSEATDAESTYSGVTSFDSDGFTLGSGNDTNYNTATMVAWGWKAGGAASSNTNGSITSQVSANPDQGFSIVGWTHDGGTNPRTIGHGLSLAPEMIIIKHRNQASSWYTMHASLPSTQELELNNTSAAQTGSDFGSTAPTSTVFSTSTTGVSGRKIIAYCWHSVDGYSKFGHYIGNSDTNGPIIFTGSLGSELLTNGDFSSNTTGWTANYSTLASVSGGYVGNCLKITRTADSYQYASSDTFTLTVGKKYRLSGMVKNDPSSPATGWIVNVGVTPGTNAHVGLTGTSSSNFRPFTAEFTAAQANCVVSLTRGPTTAAGSILFDEVSIREVTKAGFKPAWIMIKCASAAGERWEILDSKRGTGVKVAANENNAESSLSPPGVDFRNDGFQITNNSGGYAISGATYIYAAFADTTAMQEATNDKSGQTNHWHPNGFNHWDQVLDSPNNNFSVMNPLHTHTDGSPTFAEGNLEVTTALTPSGRCVSTMGVTSGKYYAEMYHKSGVAGEWVSPRNSIGITTDAGGTISGTNGTNLGDLTSGFDVGYSGQTGQKNTAQSWSAYGASWAAGDIIGVALDMDNDQVTFYKNGVSQGAISLTVGGDAHFASGDTSAGGGMVSVWNFGQDATFAGNKSPSAVYSDGKYGSFHYQPPTDFKALCTQNFPDPTIKPGEHFNVLTHTGDGGTNRAITGVGFQPDFVWFKQRDGASDHMSFDSVRGAGYRFKNNSNVSEAYHTTTLKSFDSNGYTVGDSPPINSNNSTYVSWNWKAGTSVSGTTAGAGTGKAYSGSTNPAAGFSIITYKGNDTAGHGIPHGLSKAPEFLVVKNRDATGHWEVYSNQLISHEYMLELNLTDAEQSVSNKRWYSDPDATNVYIQKTTSVSEVNGNDVDYIMYAFHGVDGYSKIGLYFGNGSADGPFIYTGFQPKYVLFKQSRESGENWRVIDDARSPYNQANKHLTPSSASVESTETGLDLLSNGFKLRNADWHQNQNGKTYIYMAFAEFPFKYTLAR